MPDAPFHFPFFSASRNIKLIQKPLHFSLQNPAYFHSKPIRTPTPRKKSTNSAKRNSNNGFTDMENPGKYVKNYSRNGFRDTEKCLKSAKNYTRRAFTKIWDSLSEGEGGETEQEDRDVLPPWVEVPPHCALDVQKICTIFSHRSEKNNKIDSILRPFRRKLNPELVLGVLKNYKRIGKERTLQFFSWAGRQRDYQHDNAVVDYMVDFFGRRKLFDDLKCLLKAVSAAGFNLVTPRTMSIAVRFLGRAGRIQEALWVFEEMENEFNCTPNNLVFNNVLYVLCKSNAVDQVNLVACIEKGLTILRNMKCPDSFSYSNVIIGLCKIGRVEQALGLFEEMDKSGVSPTRTAANNLIGKLCEANKKNPCVHNVKVGGSLDILVPDLCNKNYLDPAIMVFSKLGTVGVFPSAFVVKMLIDEVISAGKLEQALNFFNLVSGRGLRQDEETHHVILQALFNLGRIQEASNIFSKMVFEGPKPTILTYNLVISYLCKAGHLKDAEIFFSMMKKKHCPPNNVVYTALIHGHCKADNWQAASNWLDELLGLGWCPHARTFDLVKGLLRKEGKDEIADKLWEKLECLHIHKDCKAGEWQAAYQKVGKMLERGFSPHFYTLDLVDHVLRKAGKWEMAQELLKKTEEVVIN